MQHFAVVIASRPNYIHGEAFREFAETIFHALKAGGHDVTWSDTPFTPERIPIVFGANIVEHAADIPANAIIFNLEQVDSSSSWFREPYVTILRTHSVWDYSTQNIEALRDQGVTNIQYVPVGYTPELERIVDTPKDIDVLFYGSLNERRLQIIEQLRALGVGVTSVFGVYGAERDTLIARARIVLNVHFYESKIFEVVRVSYLLANGVCVLSEDGTDRLEDDFHGAVVFAPYSELVQRCLELLADDAGRERYGRRGRELMRERPQTAYLQAATNSLLLQSM
jgi:hypothetical protein